MNKDRGMIKWLPFNSITAQKEMVDNILKEKQKIKKPILSLEQQEDLEEKLIEAYYEQIPITIKIYKNGFIIDNTSTILSLNTTFKTIKLKNGSSILFNQIIEVVL